MTQTQVTQATQGTQAEAAPDAAQNPPAPQPDPRHQVISQRDGTRGPRRTRIRLDGPVTEIPAPYVHPVGRVAPDWGFVIAEHPEPGQYRHFQFVWRAAGPGTTGMGLRIGRGRDGLAVTVLAGDSRWPEETVLTRLCLGERPPAEWSAVRLDLWELTGGRLPLAGVSLRCDGGGALFDRLALGRIAADLPKPI
ncbi:hypothetical protein ACGGAI_17535 [Streptomyces antibioticus]|uniref:hypothetical protein n=1 Tax=Streptomyces antibioticus TaxID=1890 RepID=UPI0037174B9C